MNNELIENKKKDLKAINLKVVEPNDKLVSINKDKFNTVKQAINYNTVNNMSLPPIRQQINPNRNRNSTAVQKPRELSNKKKEREKELIDETTDNKSTKNSFNTTDRSLSFKNGTNNNMNVIKQDNKEQLKIIKETSPESRIFLKNMELVRKMSEKVKKGREERILQLNKPRQSPMERFNNIKKYFQIKSSTGSPRPFNHKKFELYNEQNESNKVGKIFDKENNENIYYYEIIYGGNSSEVIDECLRRRKQWRLYSRLGEEYLPNYNNTNTSSNNPNNNGNISSNSSPKFNYQAYVSLLNIYNSQNTNQNENNPLPNFIWSHSSTRLDFSEFSKYRPTHIKKMTNHFEFHSEITNKMNLFLNMMIYCENNNLDLFSMIPLTFPIRYESKNYINEISSFMQIFNNLNKYIDSDFENPDFELNKNCKYKYRNLFDLELRGRVGYRTPFHIPKTHYCGRNLWLVKAIDLNRGRCIKLSDNVSGIESIIKHFYKGMKRSFFKMVTKEMIDDEEKDKEIYKYNINSSRNNEDLSEILENKNNNQNVIHYKKKKEALNIKKNINSCKKDKLSNKIHLPMLSIANNTINEVYNSNDIKEKSRNFVDKKMKNDNNNIVKNNNANNNKNIIYTNISQQRGCQVLKNNNPQTYQNSTIIIQKYIEKPLCYNGRKCDMRLWVMLTWDFNLYIFKEGHFKATSLPYDVNSQDSYVHLTNYSVQKFNKNFAKFETGNEISFADFESSLDNKLNVKKDLLPKVKDIIIHSMKSVCGRINKLERKICFEIFGYDFMFDQNYNPFLLEVNTNPGLEISSPLIEMLIPRMIDDAFKLTIDKVFLINKKNLDKMKENPYKVTGYDDEENMWELVCNIIDS